MWMENMIEFRLVILKNGLFEFGSILESELSAKIGMLYSNS